MEDQMAEQILCKAYILVLITKYLLIRTQSHLNFDMVKITNLKNLPKVQIFQFASKNTHDTPSEIAW